MRTYTGVAATTPLLCVSVAEVENVVLSVDISYGAVTDTAISAVRLLPLMLTLCEPDAVPAVVVNDSDDGDADTVGEATEPVAEAVTARSSIRQLAVPAEVLPVPPYP